MQRDEDLIIKEIKNEENEQNKREERQNEENEQNEREEIQNEPENKTESDFKTEEQNKVSFDELLEYIEAVKDFKEDENAEKGKQNSPGPKNESNGANLQSAGTIATNNFSNKAVHGLKEDDDSEKGKQNSPGPNNELNVTNFQSAGTIVTNNFSNTGQSLKKNLKIISDNSSSPGSSSSSDSKNARKSQISTKKIPQTLKKRIRSFKKNPLVTKKKRNSEEEIVDLIENLAKRIKGHEKKKELTAKFVENFDDNSTDLQDFINAGQRFLRKRKRKVSLIYSFNFNFLGCSPC
jgi:hypothetical protein